MESSYQSILIANEISLASFAILFNHPAAQLAPLHRRMFAKTDARSSINYVRTPRLPSTVDAAQLWLPPSADS
jgi:hypothetical protein